MTGPENTPRPTGDSEVAPGVRLPESALEWEFLSGSGPGGQNVNKRAMRARLRVPLAPLDLTEDVRTRLERLAGSKIVGEGEEAALVIVSGEHRTQRRNQGECLDRLRELLVRARTRPKPRRATKPTRGSIRRRLETKKQRGQLKKRRRPPDEG